MPLPCPGINTNNSHISGWTLRLSLRGPWTHSAVDVSFSPHDVMLLVYHFGPAEYMEVFHDVFLHISQCGNLGEKSCQRRSQFSNREENL